MNITLPSSNILKVTSKRGDKESPWGNSGDNYKITASYNGNRFQFNFWDSIANMQGGKDCDLRSAIYCWASDVFVSMNASSADDIASEFGYDKPSEAIRVFKGVKAAEKQFNRIGMSEEDLQFLADY